MVNQVLALRGNDDLCMNGCILYHLSQLGYGVWMKAKFWVVKDDNIWNSLSRLQ